MAYRDKIMTSLWGRRFGLQKMSTNQTGGRITDALVGPDSFREELTTADTTAANLKAWGHSILTNSSAGSSQVWTLDPPIPGIEKVVTFRTTVDTQYLKGANGEFFKSTQGTTKSVLSSSQLEYVSVLLVPESTGAWMVLGSMSSAYVNATTST